MKNKDKPNSLFGRFFLNLIVHWYEIPNSFLGFPETVENLEPGQSEKF